MSRTEIEWSDAAVGGVIDSGAAVAHDARAADAGAVSGGPTLDELAWENGDYPAVLTNGLSLQLVAEVRCSHPDWLSEFQDDTAPGGIVLIRDAHRLMWGDALSALRRVALENDEYLTLRTAYRDLALQYYDYRWSQSHDFLARAPGESSHQAGIAVDVHFHDYWRPLLLAAGFLWPYGKDDPPHFEWPAEEAATFRRWSIEAFIALWNRNVPNDAVPMTGSLSELVDRVLPKLAVSPAAGFERGPCPQ